jgi:hypothetical protein
VLVGLATIFFGAQNGNENDDHAAYDRIIRKDS